MNKRPRVLFLCTHNSARSQMAEAFLRRYGQESFEAHSAGLEPDELNPMAIQVMQEAGIDLLLKGHRSKGLDEYFLKVHIGYLITVCENAEARCPTFPGVGVREYWGFEDPAAYAGTPEEKLAKFRHVRDQIEERVRAFIAAETQGHNP
jgi:arsenate reductase (thioredoxin)